MIEKHIEKLLKNYSLDVTFNHHDDLFETIESLIDSHRSHRAMIKELQKERSDLFNGLVNKQVKDHVNAIIDNTYVKIDDLKKMTLEEIIENYS